MISISKSANEQLKILRDTPEHALQIAVVGGGCSGLQYKLEFVQWSAKNDKKFEIDGIKIVVDPKSALYINGMTLDYTGGLNGTGFTFSNPNSLNSCGCKQSFSV